MKKNVKNKILIKKIIISILMSLLLNNKINNNIFYSNLSSDSNYIFTFWEPVKKIPGYLQLCLETWRKYLPFKKIIILNYSNLRNFIDSSYIHRILNLHMTLRTQADAIRVAVLKKYGGIWMDADTIITSSNLTKFTTGSDLIMIGNKKRKLIHSAFIYARKNSTILKKWLKAILYIVRLK
jgi:mannosyltransferase OCH1-like enzyme